MINLLAYFLAFILSGAMLGVMLLSCTAVVAMGIVIWHVVEKAYIKLRAHYRYICAKRRMEKSFREEAGYERED